MNVLCPSSTSGSTRQDVFTLMFLISPSCRFNSKINQGIWIPFCLGWKLITSLFGNCMLSHLSSYTEATVILESVISCPSAALSGCQTRGSYRGPAVLTDQLNIWIHPFILSIYQALTADLIWQVLASEISVHFYSSFLFFMTMYLMTKIPFRFSHYFIMSHSLILVNFTLSKMASYFNQQKQFNNCIIFFNVLNYLSNLVRCYGKSVFWT